jgi:hypothetical protein
MKLPNSESAYVPSPKLYDYLLSLSHAGGKGKAKFFREFGFDETTVGLLESGLLAIARQGEIDHQVTIAFGAKYIVDGSLLTPTGVAVNVRTVWIVEIGETSPRFVTAYPRPK